MKNVLGIDIGGTALKIGLVNQNGQLLRHQEYAVSITDKQISIMDAVVDSINDFLKDVKIPLSGIAVSATGQIDTTNGTVIGTCGNIPHYIGLNFKQTFERLFELPCIVVNDANCMVLGEKWIGAGIGHAHIIGITLGTGVGGGIIVNNEILLGSSGIAGEIGHMITRQNGPQCTCGNQGCYEQLASTTSLVRRVKDQLEVPFPINGRWVFDQVAQKNPLVQACLDEWIQDISTGIVSLIHIFNPTCVILGGGVSSQEKALIEPIQNLVLSKIMPRFADNLQIVPAKLQNHAGLIGAAYYFFTHETIV